MQFADHQQNMQTAYSHGANQNCSPSQSFASS